MGVSFFEDAPFYFVLQDNLLYSSNVKNKKNKLIANYDKIYADYAGLRFLSLNMVL